MTNEERAFVKLIGAVGQRDDPPRRYWWISHSLDRSINDIVLIEAFDYGTGEWITRYEAESLVGFTP